ncbi:MAG: hypothetical protein COY42_30105 [Armatimonadetes bacterium CG_4_10_14_0_8_um_filter_66_14]|nr:hypothetical protein [Armatimonadota bacterium]PIZ33339.1 MAG: hypothetical protein COY42_30105 [Armatimonadetes bacterium CG_4_10_14_0_8_um_filter_66_14]PJB69279.1 MAG: hypothetical protein CO096_13360 [Armatimonadetes bacterium CG_4_9_14_3_um_filter_66_14]
MNLTTRLLLALLLAGALVVPAAALDDIRITTDRAPDCSSLESVVASVTRECKTDDERAIAIYNFLRYVNYHYAYPSEKGGIGALKLSPRHTAVASLTALLSRFVGL